MDSKKMTNTECGFNFQRWDEKDISQNSDEVDSPDESFELANYQNLMDSLKPKPSPVLQ